MRTFRIQPTDFLPAVLDLVAAKRGREFGTRWIKKKKKKKEKERERFENVERIPWRTPLRPNNDR